MIRTYYDSIYLSPHLDDAALSCGGQIFAQSEAGKFVLILTVMAGDPPAASLTEFVHSLHERWELAADAAARRRAEDVLACRILGADHIHWEIPDCVYRTHPITGKALYASEESLFGEVHPVESRLIKILTQRIANLPSHGQIFLPMTAGHHVDHLITRAAAEQGLKENIAYYEDFPYAAEPGAIEAVQLADNNDWSAKVVPLDEAALEAKVESIATYVSQLSTFFQDHLDLERQIRAFAQQIGGERTWYRFPVEPG